MGFNWFREHVYYCLLHGILALTHVFLNRYMANRGTDKDLIFLRIDPINAKKNESTDVIAKMLRYCHQLRGICELSKS